MRRKRIAKEALPTLTKAVDLGTKVVLNKAFKNLTGGNPLHVRSNRLRGSLTSSVGIKGQSIIGRVGTNVKYGPVHEFGASIRRGSGVIRIPRRAWLGPALTSSRKKVLKVYNNALGKLYRGRV